MHSNCSKKYLLDPIRKSKEKQVPISHDVFQEMLNTARHELIRGGEKDKVFKLSMT
jgi:hypothetical protein